MIARLEGELLDKQAPCVLIDVNGVGYEVNVSLNTLVSLPEIGANLALLTHFVVREDAQTLYGFISSRERELFRALIKVNGVGPKMALKFSLSMYFKFIKRLTVLIHNVIFHHLDNIQIIRGVIF